MKKDGQIWTTPAVLLAVASLAGGGAGAWLLLHTSEQAFVALIPWLLFVATALFTFGKRATSRFATQRAMISCSWSRKP